MNLRANHRLVLDRIERAAGRAGRDPADVTLVAVTKTFPADVIVAAAEAGMTDIGESRAQELREKYAVVGDRVRWHFVGHLQTNKVRNVVGVAILIHSVDRYGVAEAISRRARNFDRPQDVLIEVNIARDAKKHGADPAQAVDLARRVASLEGIGLKGVMGMAPYSENAEDARPYFRELRDVGRLVEEAVPGAVEISMGMTRDFEVAVEEGATLVRVGEAIFGPRSV